MNTPGFNENNHLVDKLPLPDTVESTRTVDYHSYVLLHNELVESKKRTEIIAGKLLIIYNRLEKAESKITELQEINQHNVKVINSHTNSINRIVDSIVKLWRCI